MDDSPSTNSVSIRSVLGFLGLSAASGGKELSSDRDCSLAAHTSRVETPEYFKDTYKALAVAGCGNFATVYHVQHRSTGNHYACKVMNKGDLASAEIAALAAAARHRNVVQLHDHFQAGDRRYIVMEYAGGQELLSVLRDKGSLTEDDAKTVMVQLLNALDSMHSSGVVHRDIKLENVMFHDPDNLESLKVVDFGLAACRSVGLTSIRGTPAWVAPEVAIKQPYDFKCDIWAAGVMLFWLLAGYPPFAAQLDRSASTFEKKSYDIKFDDPVWELVEEGAKDCLRTLLNPTPAERPTAAEALEHPWLADEAHLYCARYPGPSVEARIPTDVAACASFEVPVLRS